MCSLRTTCRKPTDQPQHCIRSRHVRLACSLKRFVTTFEIKIIIILTDSKSLLSINNCEGPPQLDCQVTEIKILSRTPDQNVTGLQSEDLPTTQYATHYCTHTTLPGPHSQPCNNHGWAAVYNGNCSLKYQCSFMLWHPHANATGREVDYDLCHIPSHPASVWLP